MTRVTSKFTEQGYYVAAPNYVENDVGISAGTSDATPFLNTKNITIHSFIRGLGGKTQP
jgi:hypothetical protein